MDPELVLLSHARYNPLTLSQLQILDQICIGHEIQFEFGQERGACAPLPYTLYSPMFPQTTINAFFVKTGES
jgi:hypothetical protein